MTNNRSRVERQGDELVARAKTLDILKETYGYVELERGRAAQVVCCGLIIEWQEAHLLAAKVTQQIELDGYRAAQSHERAEVQRTRRGGGRRK